MGRTLEKMLTKEKDEYLKQIYYNPSQPASFNSLGKLWKHIKNEGRVTRSELELWLRKQDVHTSHRGYRLRIKRPRTIASEVDQIWASDVAYMKKFDTFNDGFGFFVVFIDVFSRFAWTYTLKTLTGIEMKKVLQDVFQQQKCQHLYTDSGSEYQNRWVNKYLTDEGVIHYTSTNETKVAHAERLIKQLKKKLYKYMTWKNTFRWIDVLQDITNSYNNTYHRIIQMTPAQARTTDRYTLWTNQYEPKDKPKRKVAKPKNKSPYKFKVGDQVNLLALRKPFSREYDESFTTEFFKIADRKVNQQIPTYTLKDYNNDDVKGQFYESEIQKINADENKVYKIEKVLRRRKRNGQQELFVKFQGWPSKFNAWIVDPQTL